MNAGVRATVLTLAALVCTGSGAQDPVSLDGTWRMTILRPGARLVSSGEIVLKATSGTIKIYAVSNIQMFDNPCLGRAFPLTVEPSPPEVALSFRVHASETVPGCPNFKVTMHLVGPNRLEGRTGLDAPVTMERD